MADIASILWDVEGRRVFIRTIHPLGDWSLVCVNNILQPSQMKPCRIHPPLIP